jgi:hypothetical protein
MAITSVWCPVLGARVTRVADLEGSVSGTVADATVVRSMPPFDEPARTAALQWSFRPARVRGMPVPAFAYIVFGFPAPVSALPRVPRR